MPLRGNLKRQRRCEDAGITLMSEGLNSVQTPGYFLDNSTLGFGIVDEVGSRRQIPVRRLHSRSWKEFIDTIKANVAKIAHIQIADVPAATTGDRRINYPNVLRRSTRGVQGTWRWSTAVWRHPEGLDGWLIGAARRAVTSARPARPRRRAVTDGKSGATIPPGLPSSRAAHREQQREAYRQRARVARGATERECATAAAAIKALSLSRVSTHGAIGVRRCCWRPPMVPRPEAPRDGSGQDAGREQPPSGPRVAPDASRHQPVDRKTEIGQCREEVAALGWMRSVCSRRPRRRRGGRPGGRSWPEGTSPPAPLRRGRGEVDRR